MGEAKGREGGREDISRGQKNHRFLGRFLKVLTKF